MIIIEKKIKLFVKLGAKNMKIRKFKKEDFDELCQVHDPARKQELHYAGLDGAFLPLKETAYKENLFSYQIYVAEVDQQISGFVAFYEDELGWLYIAPKMQRQGIGSQLIDFVLDHTKRPLYLEVLKGNPAENLYLSKGFKVKKHASGQMPGNEKFHVEADLMIHE